MINDIFNTVLSVLNKNNNGVLTPAQFNLYAKQSHLAVWEQYLHDYSLAVNRRNKHLHTSGLGDVPKRLSEVIERFMVEDALSYDATNARFNLPTDAYKLSNIYYVNGPDGAVAIDKVSHSKAMILRRSLDTQPSTRYPIYEIYNDVTVLAGNNENQIKVYPVTINAANDVVAEYIRFPRDPKWTYTAISGGEPIFNQSNADFQDFELPLDDYDNLVVKIAELAGVQIREEEVIRYAKTTEIQEKTEQNRM